MARARFERAVRFSAGHHYRRPEWSEERNRRVFGASVHPHGHDFVLRVTVEGAVDPQTGFVVDLAELDGLLRDRVVDLLDQRMVNDVVPEVREGGMVPSTENLARWAWERLAPGLPEDVALVCVRLEEGRDLAAEYRGG